VSKEQLQIVYTLKTCFFHVYNCKFFFFFFHWRYSPLWALACRTIPLHLSLSITNSLHLLTPNTWRSLSTSSFHLFLGLPFRLVRYSSWVKIFLCILASSILSRWPSQFILCPFIHFTIFSPLLNSSSSRFFYILAIENTVHKSDNVVHFRHVRKIAKKATISFIMSVSLSVCLSVSPHGTNRLPLEGFSWNLMFGYFSKICL
jgi:hypothetical protein